jgi:LmbE family N-acetylglucosaminyl deacetylase
MMTVKTTKNITPVPARVLAVGAHPDDMDFSASGTIAKWAARGSHIVYLVCTDGSKGSDDPRQTPRRLAAIRKAEQRAAAAILGVREVLFLRHRDGELVADLKLKEEIARVIRTVRPDLVITMDPAFFYSLARGAVNHPDHRAAATAAVDAVFPLARDRLNFPQHEKRGLMPHKVPILLMTSFDEPTHVEDITGTMDKKIAALEAHKSQIGPDGIGRVRDRAAALGKRAGVRYAEGFKRLILA